MKVLHLIVLLFTLNLSCSYGQLVKESSVSSFSHSQESNYSVVHSHSDVHGGGGGYYPYETTTRDPNLGSDCIDRKGKRIPVGTDYHPYKDSPCTICECLEDKRMMACSSVGCEVLACLSFDLDNDTCCGYSCKENGSYGSLDVRQVGKDSVIVQWRLDDESVFTINEISLHYSADFGTKMNFAHVPVRPEQKYVIVPGLKYGVQYTFMGIGKVYADYQVELSLKAAQIILEPRVGNALRLEERHHGNKVMVYNKGEGMKIKMDPVLFINMQTFDYIKVDQKRKRGKVRYVLRLLNTGSAPSKGGQLNLEFSDIQLFRWAVAHL